MNSRTEAPVERVRWRIVAAGVVLAGVFTAATLVFADPPAGLPDPAANPADSLIAAWTAASGDNQVFDSLRSASFTVTRIRYDTLTGRASSVESHDVWVRWRDGLPEVKIDHTTGGTTVLGFDGRTAWALQNNTRVRVNTPLQQEALRATHEILRWLEFPYVLRDSTVELTYQGTTSRSELPLFGGDGRESAGAQPVEFHAVTVDRPAPAGLPSEFTYYFRPGDRFPSDVTYTDRGRPMREVLGPVERAASTPMAYFARRDIFVGSGSRLETLLIGDFEVNPDISAVSFDAPVE